MPKIKKIFAHIPDLGGQGYHRAIWPTQFCNVTASQALPEDWQDYDVFILQRLIPPSWVDMIEWIKSKNKKFCWSVDDDLKNIPKWNPAFNTYNDPLNQEIIDLTIEVADEIIVSTDELKKMMPDDKPVHVLPNCIDHDLWPTFEKPVHNKVVICWQGSIHHQEDLTFIVPALNKIVNDYGDKIFLLFFGDMPDSMVDFVRIQHSHLGYMVPHRRYKQNVGLKMGCDFTLFPGEFAALCPDICLGPLQDCKFNFSKSNLKWMDSTMAGAAFIATDMPPYHDTPSLLVDDKGKWESWYESIAQLIENKKQREQLVNFSRALIKDKFSWNEGEGVAKWKKFFKDV